MIRLPVCLILFFGGNVFASEAKPKLPIQTKAAASEKISNLPRGFRYQAVDSRKASQRTLSHPIELRLSELSRIARLPRGFAPSDLGLAFDMDRVLISGDQSRFIFADH
jgi:hypothetical protein